MIFILRFILRGSYFLVEYGRQEVNWMIGRPAKQINFLDSVFSNRKKRAGDGGEDLQAFSPWQTQYSCVVYDKDSVFAIFV